MPIARAFRQEMPLTPTNSAVTNVRSLEARHVPAERYSHLSFYRH
jgi:hypothetical protein